MDPDELQSLEYDVALSFAGEDRDYVSKVAAALRSLNVDVYYDEFDSLNLWGKDLYVYLDEIYRKKARYCVLFLSAHYAAKAWTNHERRSAQARAFSSNQEYILPARFDSTEIPGILPTVGYINLADLSPEAFAEIILRKIGKGAKGPSTQGNDPDAEGPPALTIRVPVGKNKDYGTQFVEEQLPRIVKRALSEGSAPAVVFIDIDDLTLINKTFGRNVGDAVIDAVYEIVRRRSLGKAKYKGRCGEDTFYSVLFDADRVLKYCEKIRTDVNKYPWNAVTPKLHVSCTIGYAALKSDEEPHEWLARAILGMLDGKRQGRGTIRNGPRFSGERKPALESRPPSKTRKGILYHPEVPPQHARFSLRKFFS